MNTSSPRLSRRQALRRTLASASLLGLVGCGSSNAPVAGKSFAVSFQTLNNPFFVDLNHGIKEIIESHGDRLQTLDAKLDSAKERNDLSDVIQQQPAAIFLNPVNWEGVRGSLLAAKRAGVPIITVDTQVGDADLVAAQVASDNVQAGRLAAEALGAVKPKAKLVVLHLSITKSCLDRVKGFRAVLAEKFPDMVVLETQEGGGSTEISQNIMKDILGHVKELDAVFAINDPSALGAYAAIKSSPEWRNKSITIVSIDGSKLGKEAVKDGRLLATVEQFPIEMGHLAAKLAYDLLAGKPIEKEVKIPVKTFTKESA